MLREMGLATPLLIIVTLVVVLIALSQTTDFGPLAGGVGVTAETALTMGQNPESMEPMAEATEDAAMEATSEAESAESTPEPDAEATAEASE